MSDQKDGWRAIESAPYATWVLVWLHLPKNPPASSHMLAQRCFVQKDDPADRPEHERRTVGCWWTATARYYPAGHVTHWMPLPPPPSDEGGERRVADGELKADRNR
jgi:hypothetical protein